MNFAAVLHELELQPISTPVENWVQWAEQWRLQLPQPFLDALKQGAAELLTQHSNAEFFCTPVQERSFGLVELQPFLWEGWPIIPLLWENQGNFVYGLHLNGEPDPPVLISHESVRSPEHVSVPVNWRPFSANFAVFAFARLHDFQYLWNAPEKGWDDDWFDVLPFSAAFEVKLHDYFKVGPMTPEVYDPALEMSRKRFYRSGQRLSIKCDEQRNAFAEYSASTKELYRALKTELDTFQEGL